MTSLRREPRRKWRVDSSDDAYSKGSLTLLQNNAHSWANKCVAGEDKKPGIATASGYDSDYHLGQNSGLISSTKYTSGKDLDKIFDNWIDKVYYV